MKIIKVGSCKECPYPTWDTDEHTWRCSKMYEQHIQKNIGYNEYYYNGLPSWCPLEDREDIKELIDCEIDCIVSGNSLSPSEQEIAINTCNNLKKRIGVEI